jgi:hypothetical protein
VILIALGEEHESQRSTIDVAWHVPVGAWADHWPGRATFHQYTHGTLRAPGGRDERHFLVALGAIWNRVRLPRHVMMAAYGMALYGTYANWLTTLLGAAFGTAAASPITAAGHSGKPWQETKKL